MSPIHEWSWLLQVVLAAGVVCLKTWIVRFTGFAGLHRRFLIQLLPPLGFGIGLVWYLAKTSSNGGTDALLVGVLLVWNAWSLFQFAKACESVRKEQMEARFAWMKHTMDANTAFLHDELHRYETIENALEAGDVDMAKTTLANASGELATLFHGLAVNSLPLRLALLEREAELKRLNLRVATTIVHPDLPGMSLPAQLDFYGRALDFVLSCASAGVLSIRQEREKEIVKLTLSFSMDEDHPDLASQVRKRFGPSAAWNNQNHKGTLTLFG